MNDKLLNEFTIRLQKGRTRLADLNQKSKTLKDEAIRLKKVI